MAVRVADTEPLPSADEVRTLVAGCALSAGPGVLAYGGDEYYEQRGPTVCPSWALT